MKTYVIYSDGACSGNPGPGGWAAIVITPEGHVQELAAGESSTTNNRMEMQGPLSALNWISAQSSSSQKISVEIYTDSVYVIRGITQWVHGWRRKGWQTQDGKAVLNKDLWEILSDATKGFSIQWNYCRGHQGTPGNERCDELAVRASKKQHLDLYAGSLQNYSVAVMPPPAPQPLPEMKAMGEKPKAHSYLSMLGGIVYRHKDWASCEKRVKGQSGAKFKKAMNPENELDILKEWGLSASSIQNSD